MRGLAWWRANEATIGESPALRLAGAALGLTSTLSAIHWRSSPRFVAEAPGALCWPFFEACADARLGSPALAQVWLVALAALGLTTAVLFARPAWTRPALVALTTATLWKVAYFVQDYRLMGNYHYMPFVLTLGYLLVPNKRAIWPLLLVGFYVAAGSLKLDREWLSGAALLRPPLITGKLLELGCAYVVVLELCLVLGLLTRAHRVRWGVLLQLAAFHAFSFHIVGWFYPAIMTCLLAPLPLLWREEEADSNLLDAFFAGRVGRATYAFVGLFAGAQLVPALFPGDAALDGEGRLFALTMLDARTECDAALFVHRGNEVEEHNGNHAELAPRIHCDPLVYWNDARRLCRETPRPDTLDVYLVGRRTTGGQPKRLMAVRDFCARDPEYDVWRPNTWLIGP